MNNIKRIFLFIKATGILLGDGWKENCTKTARSDEKNDFMLTQSEDFGISYQYDLNTMFSSTPGIAMDANDNAQCFLHVGSLLPFPPPR